ncbi:MULTISPECIES: hypothetical protein [Nocardiaceae]|uniref:Ig-like domain-containing protein n=1 Tax=Rhodococcoides kroppenstedtii TaxID=293050 RepID=A0ABS7P071_9NOCA|nr:MULTISPECIES: hypothetical protein [Rhodococcus]AMY19563.1 hypothetical protein A3Q40_02189 [Rhodococcus sp. PBTS 1]MBY6315439.1 hypothetical protein [Rhodococcus kroppenstedtii]MBY6323020.1 hypothetical protein [Rhodococcus kroppenstedtii]MBY6401700.1 hypothetical protein [Rhodococcus kroppenstedtii]MBY6438623.1 hypothetical protein [Rhodococcus kroppenstedtii]
MRTRARTVLIASIVAPLAIAASGTAAAADPSDITYAYEVVGNTVTNTITSTADETVRCATSLADAPGAELPPLETVLFEQHQLSAAGTAAPGTTVTQTVLDVPPGSYVVLATCMLGEADTTQAWWLSDYPGLAEFAGNLVPWSTYTVQQQSTVVTIKEAAQEPVLPEFGDLTDAFGS